jgi:hypothetical protein
MIWINTDSVGNIIKVQNFECADYQYIYDGQLEVSILHAPWAYKVDETGIHNKWVHPDRAYRLEMTKEQGYQLAKEVPALMALFDELKPPTYEIGKSDVHVYLTSISPENLPILEQYCKISSME